MTKTLYALEGFAGKTALYLDPARRRFALRLDRSLVEGEVVQSMNYGACVVTWAQPEAITSSHVMEDRAALCARYNARVDAFEAAQAKKAA